MLSRIYLKYFEREKNAKYLSTIKINILHNKIKQQLL